MSEKGHLLKEISKKANRFCAECTSISPTFASTAFGVFICQECAVFHRLLSKAEVIPVLSDKWTDKTVSFMINKGNDIVNEEYEKYLPFYYHRPNPEDCDILRDQWIRAKYEREEFRDVSQQSAYNQGTKFGALFKRAKDSNRFQRRKFILKEPEGFLQYFIKYSDNVPKGNIPVEHLVNVYMVPEKIGNVNGMQITFEREGIRRNLYVFGEDGKTTSDWYHAIRFSMAKHKYRTFHETETQRFLNMSIIREGWLNKTGPTKLEKFRKRWFSLIGTMMWYFEQPLDAHALGFIPLGSKTFGYAIMKGFPQGVVEGGFGITIHTPDRIFVLSCNTLNARDKWVNCIEQVLDSCTESYSSISVGHTSFFGATVKQTKNMDDSVKVVSDELVENFANTQIMESHLSDRNSRYKTSKHIATHSERKKVAKPAAFHSNKELTSLHGNTERKQKLILSTKEIRIDQTTKSEMTLETGITKSSEETISKAHSLKYMSNGSTMKTCEVIITNMMNESLWFYIFQAEKNPDVQNSYVTPWVGTQISEYPASVGPISVSGGFQIAIIDTPLGENGIQRTTGPFHVEAGDIWEVEMVERDGSAPEMYYHEGMETDDGSVVLYSSAKNIIPIEVAIFKNGKKIVSRKNIQPGQCAYLEINPFIYLLQVDRHTFNDMRGIDIQACEILPRAACFRMTSERLSINIKMEKGKPFFFLV